MYRFRSSFQKLSKTLNNLKRNTNPKCISLKFSTTPYICNNEELVKIDQLKGIRIISINRPEKRNCVNVATAEALLQAFKDFDNDEESKVAVLHGEGGNFCAGYDLEEIATTSLSELISKVGFDRGPMGPTHYETSKPVIGAIEGYAVAGGLELALWCDARIMEDNAIMGVFCRRWGVPLIDGGTSRLPAIVGLGRALDIILTGRPIRAPEAFQIGLATHVCSCGSALGKAVFYAESLEKYPAEALRADRQSARLAFTAASLQEKLKLEHKRGILALEEGQIGAARFTKGVGRHGKFNIFESSTEFNDDGTKNSN